jgi:integrase/recombinase XerD
MVLEDCFRRVSALRRFRMAPLGPEMDGFSGWLSAQGYARGVRRRHIWKVAQFNEYLRRLGLRECREVQRSHVERFIESRTPRRRSGSSSTPRQAAMRGAVRSFLKYLSERGVLGEPCRAPPPYAGLLEEYLQYLKLERSLAETTLKRHARCATLVLEDFCPSGDPEALCRVSPEEVQASFAKHTQDRGPDLRRDIQGFLRSFFRFCQKQGYLQRDLSGAVPRLRKYKLSNVPRAISETNAEKTLQQVDRTTAVGRRDSAILQLLRTYGVRGGQVRALRLEDIDWRQNRIRFPALKGGKAVIVPLSDEVGEALVDYLRCGRPASACQEVFLTARAPFKPLRLSSNVSAILATRMGQAGLNAGPRGSHAFRHAFATRMLNAGESLKTIADLLGHRDINSILIYTKVDLKTLRQLPLEWPEVLS